METLEQFYESIRKNTEKMIRMYGELACDKYDVDSFVLSTPALTLVYRRKKTNGKTIDTK